MKNTNHSLDYCLEILKRETRNLSLELDNYDQKLVSHLKDYLTVDIASEWKYEHFKYFIDKLLYEKKINQEVVDLFKTITLKFQNVSPSIEEIWTLEGFKNHPFWKEQRKLAKILLEKLN